MAELFNLNRMRASKAIRGFFFVVFIVLLFVTLYRYTSPYMTLDAPKIGGFEETTLDVFSRPQLQDHSGVERLNEAASVDADGQRTMFLPGVPKAPGSHYSRVMVLPRTKDEDIDWIAEELPGLNLSVYVVDEPDAPLHPPKNKGHEVMVYLSYIIDHYDNLPDIIIFMHAHRWTYHNNELLGADASKMIRRLSNESVIREGFINMRCAWAPGCPKWLHFNGTEELMGKQEETYLAKSWRELFPLDPLPPYLAQPCCAQFAVSSERILSIPRSRFAFYRDWMMKTPLTDYVSGRIMEYSWQYIFTRKGAVCPAEHICHCDRYGICFGGSSQYDHFVQLEHRREEFDAKLENWKETNRSHNIPDSNINSTKASAERMHLEAKIGSIDRERELLKEKAMIRGDDPRLRAEECSRTWKEGDGF